MVNARWAKPIDTDLIDQLAQRHRLLVTVEEGSKRGGFGSSVLEHFESVGNGKIRTLIFGLPDRFFEHGKRELLLDQAGLTSKKIAAQVKSELQQASLFHSV